MITPIANASNHINIKIRQKNVTCPDILYSMRNMHHKIQACTRGDFVSIYQQK